MLHAYYAIAFKFFEFKGNSFCETVNLLGPCCMGTNGYFYTVSLELQIFEQFPAAIYHIVNEIKQLQELST